MRHLALQFMIVALCLSSGLTQQTSPSNSVAVPHLVRFAGLLKDGAGRPLIGTAGVTFALYRDQEGGSALWLETQNVAADKNGHYTVSLGDTKADGLPVELFTSGEARWLGVQTEGQAEQPRVLLVSVPYALKAADAETVGGLPPSAFMLAGPSPSNNAPLAAAPASSSAPSFPPPATSVTGSGTLDFLPLWTGTSTIGNSVLFQSGTGSTAKIGINTTTPGATLDVKGAANVQGLLTLPATGTATATGGKSSQAHDFVASSFNSSTNAAVNQTLQWKAEAAGNNTSTPSATLNLLFGSGTASPAETGLKLSNKGLFTFAIGQTFPGTGTITGVTTATGSGLTGGGNTGSLTLSLLKTCSASQVLQWNGTIWACATVGGTGTITGVTAGTDLTGGGTTGNVTLNLNTTATDARYAQLAAANTFNSAQTVKGNLTLSGSGNGMIFADGTKQSTAATGGGGTITGVTAGTDLTGGGSNGAVTLNLDTTKIPQLVANNTFTGTQTVNGNVSVNGTTFGGIGNFGGGVSASTQTDANFVTGILGQQLGVSSATIGVEGISNSVLGVGLFGDAYGQSNQGAGLSALFPIGVWGDTSLPGGIGVLATVDNAAGLVSENNSQTQIAAYFENADTTGKGTIFYTFGPFGNSGLGGTCSIDVNGNLSCNGLIAAVAPVDGGTRNVALYSVQSPENWFEDFGSGQVSNGAIVIALEPTFRQTVNTNADYHVFLTPNGDSRGLYVARKTATSFEVREQAGGTSNIAFDYRIVARRKGYESTRLADKTTQFHDPAALSPKKRTTPLRIPIPTVVPKSASLAVR